MRSTMLNDLSQKIDIYCISIEQKSQADFLKYLTPEEKIRAFNFVQVKHQRRYIICQGMLRVILAKYLALKPEEIKFKNGKYGKPYLNHDTNINFNVSHSHEMALIAVALNQEIGIDIEYHSKRNIDGIAEKMFSAAEIARVHQAKTNKIAVFYEIWTGKEAFIKAIGMGLHYPTPNITIPKLQFTPQTIDKKNAPWYIQKLNLQNKYQKYSSALCMMQSKSEIEIFNL